MQKVSYRNFSDHIHHKFIDISRPLLCQFELTFRCNLNCPHCYCVQDPTKKELSFKEITLVLDQLADVGCLWLCFTGGEPLLREDFLDIYLYAKKKGFIITLFTNATLINEKIISVFKKYPPFSIEVTLNGITPETYEKTTAKKDSFEKIMKAIGLIIKNGLDLKIRSQMMNTNIHEIKRIEEFVNSLHLDYTKSYVIFPRMDGSREPLKYRVSADNIIKQLNFTAGYKRKMKYQYKFYQPTVETCLDCTPGRKSFNISPYGELSLCNFDRQRSLDLKKHSFKYGFFDFLNRERKDKLNKGSLLDCVRCRIRFLCSVCRWQFFLENNSSIPPEWFCQVAQKKAEKLGLDYDAKMSRD